MRVSAIICLCVAAFLLLGLWYSARPVVYAPGVVEKQIHGFGPRLVPALAANSAFTKTANGYQPKPEPPQAPAGLNPVEAQAWTAMAKRLSGESALSLTFPEHYSEGTHVRGQGMTVSLKPLGSHAASAQIENGKLVYHNAYPSTDSLNVVSDGRSEEFLLLHDASAPQKFEYDLSAVSGVKNISLSDNAVHFTNAQGQQMQIEAPWLVESGQAVATAPSQVAVALRATGPFSVARSATATSEGAKVNQVHWELSYPNGPNQPRLALVINNPGKLRYPVVIDPTWVVTNGDLNNARAAHTATLLPNGQVLVVGGQNLSQTLSSAELYNPATGIWTFTGSLNTARENHTATLLPNGEVLVACGVDNNSNRLTSAELYNPTTGTWTATGDLHTARVGHTATLLPNGQVLVAGGAGNSGYLSSAELYNPATGIWTATGSLSNARFIHTATLLPNGLVLVAGGYNYPANGYLTGAELYNSTTGTWTATGNLSAARGGHTATLLPNGEVLVATGGGPGYTYLSSAELYNSATGTWTVTGSLTTARQWPSATLLPNGQVLVAGGFSGGAATGSAEIYNPSTGLWTAAGSLNTGRELHTATLLPNGQILVAGGQDSSNNVLASVELYNPAAGTFSNTGSLNTARASHTATLLPNGQILVAGGYENSGVLTTAELFNQATGTWTATGSLNTGRFYHTATLLPNGQVLVAGGGTSSGSLTSAELYNSATGTWTATGSLNNARYLHTATLLPNGQVLVAGGYGAGTSAELYNSATGTWTVTGSLNAARENYTATLLPNGLVLAAGGYYYSSLASAELYNPATGTWTATGNLSNDRNQHTATLLPNGQVLVAGGLTSGSYTTSAELYNPVNGTWTATGSLNTARNQHTATLLPNGQVLVVGGEGNSGDLASAELYNSATGTWTATGNLNTARNFHTATLLSNGQALVAGGSGNPGPLTSSELFDPGLGYSSATQPQLNAISSVNPATALNLTGTLFTGVSEASGGATNTSSSNIPVVQLQSLVNEQVINVPLDPSQGFSSTSFTSLPPTGLVPGYALLTMFVNGTPSLSQIVSYSLAAQTISNFPSSQTLNLNSSPDTLPAATSDGLTITYSVTSGPATVSGNILTLTGTGSVLLLATQSGDGVYAPLSETETINVTNPPVVPFSQWEAQPGFFTSTDPLVIGPTVAPEGDAIPNLFKYLYNINPAQPMAASDRVALPVFSAAANGNLTLTFREYASETGITVVAQTSPDLQNWTTLTQSGTLSPTTFTMTPTGTLDPITNDPYMEVDVLPTGAARQFIRLNVTMP